ncbi:hypothetical protein [Streptomyces sp. NPDC058145]|uniref:hypothetical protein n=1 Tax=Streptomyces sp. NPDC058145 TaxID=3346356 RepID=UPI0036DFAC8C
MNKLQRVRRLELPADLFADVSEKLVDAWRARASKKYPANLERMKPPGRLTLLAALCHVRQTEITDSLVDLFIQLVLKINTRAERKVDKELNAELKKVRGKEGMLLRVAEAVNPYGRFELDMNSRLDLDLSIRATVPGPRTPQEEAAAAPA